MSEGSPSLPPTLPVNVMYRLIHNFKLTFQLEILFVRRKLRNIFYVINEQRRWVLRRIFGPKKEEVAGG
jgi:hypothetical protein